MKPLFHPTSPVACWPDGAAHTAEAWNGVMAHVQSTAQKVIETHAVSDGVLIAPRGYVSDKRAWSVAAVIQAFYADNAETAKQRDVALIAAFLRWLHREADRDYPTPTDAAKAFTSSVAYDRIDS